MLYQRALETKAMQCMERIEENGTRMLDVLIDAFGGNGITSVLLTTWLAQGSGDNSRIYLYSPYLSDPSHDT